MKSLLLIGETTTKEGIGGKFLRALHSEDLNREWKSYVQYTSPAINYSPSMAKFSGKLFYRLAGKRSWEWWGFQKKLINTIVRCKPNLILVTGILPISGKVFEAAKEFNCCFVNYLTDDPWNPIHKRNSFINNIEKYDHIFSTKEELCQRLESNGARSTSWLPFAYDPQIHKPPDSIYSTPCENPDVVFVGTGAKERCKWLTPLAEIPEISPDLWERLGQDKNSKLEY